MPLNRRSFLGLRPKSETDTPYAPGLSIAAGLEAHGAPLEASDIKHALRRTAFGTPPGAADLWQGRSAQEFADGTVDAALGLPMPDPPVWANEAAPDRTWTQDERRAYVDASNEWLAEFRLDWLSRMQADGFRERLALAWHNHFVTGVGSYRFAVYAYRYVSLLREHALGNLKDFVRAVGLDPAMLIYLNGIQNRVGAPNENYARELMELFTMGPAGPDGSANYSEDDIRELARALTGWQVSPTDLAAVFNPARHDAGLKTIFGVTGNFGYFDGVDLLFDQRGPQIAHFVCAHLYRTFVYSVVDEAVVAEMASLLIASDFELAPVLRTLFSSAHFFDPAAQGVQIKSPIDLVMSLSIETGIQPSNQTLLVLNRTIRQMGQVILDPPNVAGWPGHHDWINTNTLPSRWLLADTFLSGRGGTDIEMIGLCEQIHDALDTEAAFRLPLALVEHLVPAQAELLDIPVITDDFGGDLINFPVPDWLNTSPPHIRNLAKLFLGGLPWYEWSLYVPGANERVVSFVRQIAQYPEFQLA
ncbi:MAG: hypothetical protein ACI80V_001877 [Rhodothermales bacterium]|jgi:uncharacterized protein (DUF1800 family)